MMSKIAFCTILSAVLLAIITVINIRGVGASEATKFVPVSVLARDQANYGVDKNAQTIPAVSPKIIEDKVEDIESVSKAVRTIEYTTLPIREPAPATTNNNQPQTVNQPTNQTDPGNNGNSVTNPTQIPNQNNNGNSQNKDKNKGNGKDKNQGGNGGTDSGNENKKAGGVGSQSVDGNGQGKNK